MSKRCGRSQEEYGSNIMLNDAAGGIIFLIGIVLIIIMIEF